MIQTMVELVYRPGFVYENSGCVDQGDLRESLGSEHLRYDGSAVTDS